MTATKPYKMPTAQLGQIVYWYPSGQKTDEPHAAIITRLGGRNLNLNIFDPQNYNFLIRDGVRHVDDPDTRTTEARESGCWDFTMSDKLLSVALEQLGQFRQEIEHLHSRITGLEKKQQKRQAAIEST